MHQVFLFWRQRLLLVVRGVRLCFNISKQLDHSARQTSLADGFQFKLRWKAIQRVRRAVPACLPVYMPLLLLFRAWEHGIGCQSKLRRSKR